MVVKLPHLRDCLVFLCHGTILIRGQGEITETGYAYVVKNEECLGLGENTAILVMEQGGMKGVCNRKTGEETGEELRANQVGRGSLGGENEVATKRTSGSAESCAFKLSFETCPPIYSRELHRAVPHLKYCRVCFSVPVVKQRLGWRSAAGGRH